MSKRKLELTDQKRALNAAIAEARDLIDGHARGERFRELAEAGAALVKHATRAVAVAQELNAILTAEWAERRR